MAFCWALSTLKAMVFNPRNAKKQSKGAKPVPSAFCTKYNLLNKASSSTQQTPAIVSE